MKKIKNRAVRVISYSDYNDEKNNTKWWSELSANKKIKVMKERQKELIELRKSAGIKDKFSKGKHFASNDYKNFIKIR
ncbi:MAG: hypothetical protein AB1765_07630 [Candidatus Hydrogenedentota bacterium]